MPPEFDSAPWTDREPEFLDGVINDGGFRLKPPWLALPHNRD